MFSLFGRKKEPETPVKQKKKIIKSEPFVTKEFLRMKPVHKITHEHIHEVRIHPKGGWQVIIHGGQKALKRFETSKEAIAYCKERNFLYRVYKKDGTLRK